MCGETDFDESSGFMVAEMVNQDAKIVVPGPIAGGGENPPAHSAPSRGAACGDPQGVKAPEGQGGSSYTVDLGHPIRGDPRLLHP